MWTMFTKRTDDPKLAWLERKLDAAGILHRRHGQSFHAPILQVHEEDEQDAWSILDPVDEIDDDAPMFTEGEIRYGVLVACTCGGHGRQCHYCRTLDAVNEAVTAAAARRGRR